MTVSRTRRRVLKEIAATAGVIATGSGLSAYGRWPPAGVTQM